MLCQLYLTPPSSPRAIAINTESDNNSDAKENQYSAYTNHYGTTDNNISLMHEIRQQQQQQCGCQLEDIRAPLFTNNISVTHNAFYIDNNDLEKMPTLLLQQFIPTINNNNNDFQQEYCTNHRVTFQKGKLSNTFPIIHDNHQRKPKWFTNTTVNGLSSVEHPQALTTSQSNDHNNNTALPDSLFLKLPFDILERIFKFLNRTALICCASTCKRWCCFFLEWHYFWKVVKNDPIIIPDNDNNNGFVQQRILKEPSTRIGLLVEKILYRRRIDRLAYYRDYGTDEEIISDKSDEEEYIKEIINLMADIHYTRLKSIHLSKMTNIDPTILSKALVSSSSNLTTVHLHHCDAIPPEIVLGEILDKCQSLLELSYIQQNKVHQQHSTAYNDNTTTNRTSSTSSTSNYWSTSPRRKRLALRKLFIDLGHSNNYGTVEAMEEKTGMYYFLPNVIQKCPNLQLLVWNPADYTDHNRIFHNINQYCSYIQWMVTTTATIYATNDNHDNNEYYSNNQQEPNTGALIFDKFTQNHYIPPSSGKPHQGLIRLDIFDPAINVNRETLDSILKKHSTTIKTIYLPYNGRSRIFWEVLNAMIENPLINLQHTYFVGTAVSCFDYPITSTSIMTTSSKSPSNHRTTPYAAMGNIDNFDFISIMTRLVSSWKKLESISFNGYYSEMDTSVCVTRCIVEQLLFRCKNLNQVSFAHCFENVHEFANGLKILATSPTDIRDLTLDCGLLVSFINRYNIEEYLVSGALQKLQVLRVTHVPNTSVANPCFCQCSAILYKLFNIRKILNSREGDVLYSSPMRAFIIV